MVTNDDNNDDGDDEKNKIYHNYCNNYKCTYYS